MPVGSPKTQAGITIAIARDPSLVRTVRLVAAAVARRASPSEDLVEEVRLAVGEACAVMVSGLIGLAGPFDPPGAFEAPGLASGGARDDGRVRLQMDIADRLFVSLECANEVSPAYEGAVDPWALLRGLTDDLVVTNSNGTTAVAMSWPI